MITSGMKSRLHRIRKLAYAPLVVAIAAGAICTGAGFGSAAPAATATTPAPTDTPQSGATYDWYLLNHTGQSIYGNWNAEMELGSEYNSHVEAPADHPWQPNDAATAAQHSDWMHYTTWTGRICYKKRWWAYAISDFGFGDDAFYGKPVFRLEADSADDLFVYYSSPFHYAPHPLTLQPLAC
ncbi:hypothetical protein [Rhodococcus jostii]|uniref:hypothetical protein n=1 Tax=Rhodococcus jostii TaxID=132919 RepID=UPI0036297E96